MCCVEITHQINYHCGLIGYFRSIAQNSEISLLKWAHLIINSSIFAQNIFLIILNKNYIKVLVIFKRLRVEV